MKRGKFVSAPGGEPIRPAQIQLPAWMENRFNPMDKAGGITQMLQDIRADYQIVSSQAGHLVFVQIDLEETRMLNMREQVIPFVRKRDRAAQALSLIHI